MFVVTDRAVFCITRIVATGLRIAWSFFPKSLHLGITATVFVYAGIVLLFLANLFFAQRVVRAQHPQFGWSKSFTISVPLLCIITGATILCMIASVIVSFYTSRQYPQHVAHTMQKVGAILLAVIAFLPFAIVGLSSLVRRMPRIRMTKTTDKFGEGSMRAKIAIVLVSAFLLCLGASFRAAIALLPPVPIRVTIIPPTHAPAPWYLSKECFYLFNFTIEFCVCLFWLTFRIDRRFYIPDGANGPFSYAGGFVFAGEFSAAKSRASNQLNGQTRLSRTTSLHSRVSRVSWAGSRSSKVSRIEKTAARVSWGGISRDEVHPGLGEDGKEIPYPAFAHSGHYGYDASDIGVDGAHKEMGWDPKSGKWAVRPISFRPSMDSEG